MLETSNLASSDLASSLEDSMSGLEDSKDIMLGKAEMLEMSELASSLEDSMPGLEGRTTYILQRHVVVKGRDAGDERPDLKSRRFYV
jgi:hypothetical protein